MTEVQLILLDQKQQDHNEPGTMVYARLHRVPVAGDFICHNDEEYAVSTVVLSTVASDKPYVIAKL